MWIWQHGKHETRWYLEPRTTVDANANFVPLHWPPNKKYIKFSAKKGSQQIAISQLILLNG